MRPTEAKEPVMSNTSDKPAAAWSAPHLAIVSNRQNSAVFWALLLLVGALSCYEAVLIKPAVDLVLNESDVWSWIVAVMLSVAAAVMMLESGYLARKARGEGHRSGTAVWLLVTWAVLGLGIAVLRWDGIVQTQTPLTIGGVSTAQGDPREAWLIPLVLLAVFNAAGVMNNATGRTLFNPFARGHASARRTRARLTRRIARERAALADLVEQLEVAKSDLLTVPELRESAERTIEAFFAELLEETRLRMLLPLGEPEITSAAEVKSYEGPAGLARIGAAS